MTEPSTPRTPQGPENWPAGTPQTAPTQEMPASRQTPAAGAPGGPPPRRPNLWRQATSTTGGLIALIVAGCLALLLVLGVVGAGLFFGLHAWGNHRGAQIVRMAAPGEPFAPGPRQQLKRQQGVPGPGLRGNGLGQAIPGLGALGSVQHGEFTVAGANGQATVMTLQRGTVTAASGSSVTVRSTDGYTATYAVDSSTRGNATKLANGDTVLVVATKSGSKAVLIRAARIS
ncbi:MAG TPA: hypothetical protein VGN48_18835 [Pedococcus sp.]|nr:hypothetical protein [Pedococcus sp.]